MATVFPVVLAALLLGQVPDDQKAIQGTWKVTALIEDGLSLSEKQIATEFTADGRVVVEGNTVSVLPPGSFERRKMVFLLNAAANPRTVDLAGAQKVGSQGIYLLAGDSLVLCLAAPGANVRPGEFSANKGSGRMLLALQRVPVNGVAVVKPQTPPPTKVEPSLRDKLIGTWGHQDDNALYYYTLNADGTFSSTQEYKKGLKKLFEGTVRSSGTWKLEGQVVVISITVSDDEHRRGQIYSAKITNLGPNELICIDQQGQVRREWRVR